MTERQFDKSEAACKVCGETPPFKGGTRCQRTDCGLINWGPHRQQSTAPVPESGTRLGNWKPPFAYEFIKGKDGGGGHYRIHDARDSAISFCYSEFDAQDVVFGMNAAVGAKAGVLSATGHDRAGHTADKVSFIAPNLPIWLRHTDNYWTVSVELPNKMWVEVIRESDGGPTSHVVEPSGIQEAIDAAVKGKAPASASGTLPQATQDGVWVSRYFLKMVRSAMQFVTGTESMKVHCEIDELLSLPPTAAPVSTSGAFSAFTGWIACSDRLPPTEGAACVKYLCWFQDDFALLDFDNQCGWLWGDGSYMHHQEQVTHWREIPPGPYGSAETVSATLLSQTKE